MQLLLSVGNRCAWLSFVLVYWLRKGDVYVYSYNGLTLKMSTLKILHRPIELSTKLIKPSYLVSFLDLVPVFLLKHLGVGMVIYHCSLN